MCGPQPVRPLTSENKNGLPFMFLFMIIIRMYICVCNAITERQVRESVAAGATTLADLQFELGVATCCGCCAETAQEYLPGGRCAADCNVRTVTAPGSDAANGFPVPLVAAA